VFALEPGGNARSRCLRCVPGVVSLSICTSAMRW